MAYYDLDILGQDPSGRVSGLHPMYGAAIGSGLGTATSELVQFLAPWPRVKDHAEGIGFAVAALAGGAMMFLGEGRPLRAAGWAAILAAAANNGVRYVVDLLMPSTQETLEGYALQALNGAYNLEALNGAYNLQQLAGPADLQVLNAPGDSGLQVLNAPGYQEMSQMASAFGVTGI
jgi:hypothetical protein